MRRTLNALSGSRPDRLFKRRIIEQILLSEAGDFRYIRSLYRMSKFVENRCTTGTDSVYKQTLVNHSRAPAH